MEQLKELLVMDCCFFLSGLMALVDVVECFLLGSCMGVAAVVAGVLGCVILVRLMCKGLVLNIVIGGRSSSLMMKEPIGGVVDGVQGWILGVSVMGLLSVGGVGRAVELEAVEDERAHLGQ